MKKKKAVVSSSGEKRQGLENNVAEQFMGKISERVRTAAYLRHSYSYWLENIEDGTRKTQEARLG